MTHKILFIAGEVSGDRLAAHALQAAKDIAHEKGITLDISGIGGDETRALGANIYYSDKEMSVIGFAEVMKRYYFYRSVFRKMVSLLDSPDTRPHTVFLVDYPGFNLRFAKQAKKRGIKVIYYVSPQVWAWKKGRIKDVIRNTDELLVIFPFEEILYRERGHHHVTFVGHPLVEQIEKEEQSFVGKEEFAKRHGLDSKKEWLLVFPGSRKDEITHHLSVMTEAAKEFGFTKNYEVIIVQASGVEIHADSECKVFHGSSHEIHELMSYGKLGILKSGTTTLEAGLMGLAGVICYKTSRLTYLVAKALITLPYIGLVNIVLEKKLYPELIQNDLSVNNLITALSQIEQNTAVFNEELRNLRVMLRTEQGGTARRVAEKLLS